MHLIFNKIIYHTEKRRYWTIDITEIGIKKDDINSEEVSRNTVQAYKKIA